VRYGFSTATEQPIYKEKLDDNQEKEIQRKAELEDKSEVAAAVNTSTRGKDTRSSRD
jgi:hypothetical protein